MSIEVHDLSKSYDGIQAVQHLNFEIPHGTIAGFLGPNGAGKSTTMRILTGFLPPSSGTAHVCGYNVALHPLEVRRKLGYLPESNPLYADMYVQEYLEFVAGVFRLGRNTRNQVAEAIALTGLESQAHKQIRQLSKGYRQRVGLAQALVHNPEVLILDEPTAGLDPNQLQDIRQLIRSLTAHKTVLLSTHILQEVEAMCDRVIILHKGLVVADAPIEQMKSASQKNELSLRTEEFLELDTLAHIQGVERVNRDPDGTYRIQASSMELARKNILQMALQCNWNIVSLQSHTKTLEAIFRELTHEQATAE